MEGSLVVAWIEEGGGARGLLYRVWCSLVGGEAKLVGGAQGSYLAIAS